MPVARLFCYFVLLVLVSGIVGCGKSRKERERKDLESRVVAQELQRKNQIEGRAGFEKANQADVVVEYFEIPAVMGGQLQNSETFNPDADGFRREVQLLAKSGQAKLRELMVAQVKRGVEARSVSLQEGFVPVVDSIDPEPEGPASESTEEGDSREEGEIAAQTEQEKKRVKFQEEEHRSFLQVKWTDDASHLPGEISLDMASVLAIPFPAGHEGEKYSLFHRIETNSRVTLRNGRYAVMGGGRLPSEIANSEYEGSMIVIFLRVDRF
ncbi:MAG: hypothetical protein P1U85_10500 [Verrucomicrobiales bacterium]|nr:hypothetical protein [Verrucomicrobiales bacterium]